jgi:D-glycero-D-manno-heptose 1,7-bisphosphate phosphatase
VELSRLAHSSNQETCRPQLYIPPESRLTPLTLDKPGPRAVFLDRDGIIIKDMGYLTELSQIRLLPGAVEGIRLLQDQFFIVVVTNQSGVARGLLDKEKLVLIHQKLAKTLKNLGVFLDAIYSCPHLPASDLPLVQAQCYCRKPRPGMLFQARDDFGIRLHLSFMVGDKYTDILAGHNAGVAATILLSSHKTESKPHPDVKPTYTASNLPEASELILNHRERDV